MNLGAEALSSFLVVIYGAPLSGKSSTAWRLAKSLPSKTAVVSFDGLIEGSIAVRAEDEFAELEMVHIQARLLVANYMKNGYNVVVEGPFYYRTTERLHRFEQDIEQLVNLMRQMTYRYLLVRLTASDETIRRRATEGWRESELEEAGEIAPLYKDRMGRNAITVDTTTMDVEAAAEAVRQRLLAEDFT
jgi:tRNA uridine 5-carbamoylmethylation protein Kti12